ncbi:PHB depolymerase family esterase [Xanthobacter sp. KR7-65]|uniref:extracellular catalytic domain type 1 short-chain-length polyhydroxyalkanoate depolymerase n=1 Tax=Xanthobacter sp. KR7-65 TaxID=3156612 RepID=UPI0032B35B4B
MALRSKIDLMEATRLTRQGRLEEAMAILRDGLSGAPSGDAPEDANQRGRPFVDLVPPSAATGDAWTAPSRGEAGSVKSSGPARAPTGSWLDGLMDFARDRVPGALSTITREAPVAPRAGRFEDRSFSNAAGRRSYKLYIPASFDGQPLPLLVMLHGCTQSPEDFAAGTRMNALAEEHTFLVAYPAQSREANGSGCWNWFNAADQRRDRGEPSLIAGITREIMAEFPVDPARVFAAGLSAGGATAAIMGATYPDLFRAVGVHSGLACGAARDVQSAFAAMRHGSPAAPRGDGQAVPTIVFHGDRDNTVHPLNGDQVAAQVVAHVAGEAKAEGGLDTKVTTGEAPGGVGFTRKVHSDESGRSLLEQWVLHGVGHAWSGGSPSGSYTEPRGPDASREMVRFFLESAPA